MQNYFQSSRFYRLHSDFQPNFFCTILGISLGGGKKSSNFNETTEQEKITEQETLAKTIATNEQTATQESTGKSETEATIEQLVNAIAQSTEQTTSEKASTVDVTGSISGTSAASSTDKSSGSGSINEAFQSLDEETQALLQGLIGDIGEGGLEELTVSLTDRALTADADLAGIVDPIVANQRANLEESLGQSIQGFARSAGGTTQNTIVQQLGLKEGARVEREVADLAATLGLETRQLVTAEQTNAAGLTGTLLEQLTGLLKGSQTTRAGESTTDAVRALEELTTTESESRDSQVGTEVATAVSEAIATEDTTSKGVSSTVEITEALSQSALSELSETVSEQTMNEIISALTKASGSGTTRAKSAGLSLGI